MDPVEIRLKNMVREGDVMRHITVRRRRGCALDRCLERTAELIGWKDKYPYKDMGNGKVRSVGIAMAMQGSGISGVDVGSATIKMNDDGFYTLMIAAADMGTGCDTILAQMAAGMPGLSGGKYRSPWSRYGFVSIRFGILCVKYDICNRKSGRKACQKLIARILEIASGMLDAPVEELEFASDRVEWPKARKSVSLIDIGTKSMCGNGCALEATESNSSPTSPTPFMAGAVEIELDKETGHVEILDYKAVWDCGTVVNPNLARVQTEGGLVQGIGMTLYETSSTMTKEPC